MKPLLKIVCWSLLAFAGQDVIAQDLAAYHPHAPVSGVVRVWTNPQMREMMRRWSDGFQKHHPDAHISANFQGSDVAVAGLYTRFADVALIGRESTASEIQAFEWIYRYRPTRVEVMTGSLDRAGKSAALVMFVHKDNPLTSLTLAQAEAIFGHERLRGAEPILTWGQLGVGGEWKDRPIRLYGYDAYSGSGRYFRQAVLNDSRNMNWDRLQEFGDGPARNGKPDEAGARIHDALARDKFGMAVSILSSDAPASKALALAAAPDGPFVAATPESVAARRYPMARAVVALINRAPGQPVDPKVAEFLRYVLSRDGQAEVAREGAFLPLAADNATQQLKRIE